MAQRMVEMGVVQVPSGYRSFLVFRQLPEVAFQAEGLEEVVETEQEYGTRLLIRYLNYAVTVEIGRKASEAVFARVDQCVGQAPQWRARRTD